MAGSCARRAARAQVERVDDNDVTVCFRRALSWMSLRYDNGLEIAISISRYLATYSNPPGMTGYMRRQSARRFINQSMSFSRISALRLATGAREMSGVLGSCLAVAKDSSPGCM